MRWLINSNGQTSGPMDEAMVATLVKAGQLAPEALFREEHATAWLPLSQTSFAPVARSLQPPTAKPEAKSARKAGPSRPQPRFNLNELSLTQALFIGALFIGAVGTAGWLWSAATSHTAPDAAIPPLPAAASTETPAAPPPPTVGQRLAATADLPMAIAILTPEFDTNATGHDPAAAVFAVWSTLHMTWPALQNIAETQRALVMKDPTAEVGKRLCWSGSVIEISTDRSSGQPIYAGGLINNNGDVVRFFTVGSSGDIVEHAWARLCGIVTGVMSYANSGGGTTHSVQVVGMFDLPKNKPGYAPATAQSDKVDRGSNGEGTARPSFLGGR